TGSGTTTGVAGGATSTGTATGTATGSGVGGAGGAGGDDSDLVAMQDAIDGLRVEHECQNVAPTYCDTVGVVTDEITCNADPSILYEVDILVRGIVELTSYQGGTADGYLYIGGSPLDSWNTYGLEVSDPPAHYWFNGNSCCEAWLKELSIPVTLVVAGDATVTLTGDDRNLLTTINQDQSGNPIVVSGVPPDPAPFDGQFVHVLVTDVRRQ
ncbi:MAG: hypothetical protein JRI23_04510, partial [Deltaproteobacteria bacterium]|nr:hypothetical protein [Deltaproteobacteria bacterium]MBW2530806.1 hypothetical protein [Deltaproteobacteria bacterium]